MKLIVLLSSILLINFTVIKSQEFFEANGQTCVFTLKVGETSESSNTLVPRQQIDLGAIVVQTTTNKLVVNFSNRNTKSAEIRIYNINGKVQSRVRRISEQIHEESLSELAAGVYSISIIADGIRHNCRIQVLK